MGTTHKKIQQSIVKQIVLGNKTLYTLNHLQSFSSNWTNLTESAMHELGSI